MHQRNVLVWLIYVADQLRSRTKPRAVFEIRKRTLLGLPSIFLLCIQQMNGAPGRN